jgi:hypothetical protein
LYAFLDAIEEDETDLPLIGDGTHGDWPWVKGLESEVDDKGVGVSPRPAPMP